MNLWLSYCLLGEGWSLTEAQFMAIFRESSYLRERFAFNDDQLIELFTLFDTDNNGLVDALEFLVAVGLLSGTTLTDYLNFYLL